MISHVFGLAGLYIGLAVFIIAFEFSRPKKLPFDFLFIFNISYLVYFALAPIHILIGGRDFVPISMLAIYDQYLIPGRHWLGVALAAVVIFSYTLVLVGYYSRSSRSIGLRVNVAFPDNETLFRIALLFGVTGSVALFIYGLQFNGVLNVILKGALIRGGVEKSDSNVLFLMHFIQFINCASILVFAVLIGRRSPEPRTFLRAVFLGSLVLVLVAVLAVGARRSFVLYSAALYFMLANKTGERHLRLLGGLAVGFFALLLFGDQVLIGLSSGAADVAKRVSSLAATGSVFLYQAIWRDLTLPFIEFVGVVMLFEGWPRLFMDIPLGFLEAIPQRLVPLELPPLLVEESTELLSGQKLGDIAAIPTGFLGFGWYAGLLPGVIVTTLLFGWCGGFLESALRINRGSGAAAVVVYVLTGFTWAYSIRIGIPGMILNERFHWFALLFLLFVVSRITVSKEAPKIASWNFRSRGVCD